MRILLNICNVHIDMHVNKIKGKKIIYFFSVCIVVPGENAVHSQNKSFVLKTFQQTKSSNDRFFTFFCHRDAKPMSMDR